MFIVLGATATVLALLCLLILLTASRVNSNLHSAVDHCNKYLLPDSNSTTVFDALALDEESWFSMTKNCNAKWEQEVQATVRLINQGDIEAAKQTISAQGARRQLKLMVLFGYSKDPDAKLAHLCSQLDDKELAYQCLTDVFKRMQSFHHQQDIGVLSFWFYLDQSDSPVADDLLSTVNASQISILDEIVDEISGTCTNLKHKCMQFVSLKKEVQKFFLPALIATYFETSHIPHLLLKFINNTLPDQDCFAYKQMYLQMKIYNNLDKLDALELRFYSLNSKTKHDENLCYEVQRAILEHVPQHALLFITLFDGQKYEQLLNNELTVLVVGELVKKRYEGGKKTQALMDFLWRWNRLSNIACVGSLALEEQMRITGNLSTFQAVSLFSHINWHRDSYQDTLTWTNSCKLVKESAPDFIKHFLYGDSSCDCCDLSKPQCVDATLNILDSILGANLTNAIEEFPREVLFIGYVLQYLTNKNLSEAQKKRFSAQENGFRATYNVVFEDALSSYRNDENATSPSEVSTLGSWFNNEVLSYVQSQIDERMSAKGNLLPVILYRSEGIHNLSLKCRTFETTYKGLERKSEQGSTYAFALWLFIESYVLILNTNARFKDVRRKCEQIELKLRNSTKQHLDDYFESWNDPSQQTRIIEWHDNFRFSSAWVLPKLVRHVFLKRNETTAESVIDFFGNLVTKSETLDKLDLCAGLRELVVQMRKCGDLENQNLTTAVENLIPANLRNPYYYRPAIALFAALDDLCMSVIDILNIGLKLHALSDLK
jgi:hypothetical protein